ncbi:MAG: DUF3050 domain-containing protein [Acetobacteraceae bacterium]
MSLRYNINDLLLRLEPVRHAVAGHPMYTHLRSCEDVRIFMQFHVYAVWDFMALLKALQRHLTCTQSTWSPRGAAQIRRLVNEMVLEEESDEIDGAATSHFELYRAAMQEAGADGSRIDAFMARIREGWDVDAALAACSVPPGAQAFVRSTFETISSGQPHVIASAFAFGREDTIPSMFGSIISAIPGRQTLATFELYLNRHIQLDGGAHGSMAIAMLNQLCGADSGKWREAAEAAVRALGARIALWTAIQQALEKRAAQFEMPSRPAVH